MATFKKILSFLKGSKKRKSVVIHDSRVIHNENPKIEHAGSGKMKNGTNKPVVGNGSHYEQFLYVDDDKNGGKKKRTLSVVPSVVSSSNYTQTDQEFSDTLSHLRSDSTKFGNHNVGNKINGKPMNRVNGIGNGNRAFNKNSIGCRKSGKSFTLKQDPIEEEKIIVEIQDNNKEEIEIDEDELIVAVQEFENERNRRSGVIVNSGIADQNSFILKEDKEDENGNQSFIIKNINDDDIHSKKLSFIISSSTKQGFGGLEDVEEENEENLNTFESSPISSPDFTNNNSNGKGNNDLFNTINKSPQHEEKEVESEEVLSNVNNKKKVLFTMNDKTKGTKTPEPLTKTLTHNNSLKSKLLQLKPKPKPIINSVQEEFVPTLSSKNSIKSKNSNENVLKTKSSDQSIPLVYNRGEITEMNENKIYKNSVPAANTNNIFFMPLPRPSQATLLDFGSTIKNSPLHSPMKSKYYSQIIHSKSTLHSNSNHPWNDAITSNQNKENIPFSAPIKPSVPIVKTPKEGQLDIHTSTINKSGSYNKIKRNLSSNTPISATSLYTSKLKQEKPIQNPHKTSTPYVESQSTISETSSSCISDTPVDKPYILSPNISVVDENDELNDQQSDSSITSNTEDDSFVYSNYRRICKSREESLRNVKAYVESLDDAPDTDSIFSTPLAYRRKYERYGSIRSQNKSLKPKKSSLSSNTETVEGSSVTEYSNSIASETASSFSYQTNSTNRTAPIQNSVYRDYYKSYNKPTPVSTIQMFKNNAEDINVNCGDILRKEKFNSDSTIVNAYNKKYNRKSSNMKQGKHQNHSSISSGSTLACSPLPKTRSLLNNNNNINKYSIMTAESNNYFDDFMKDLHDLSLNDLVIKYEQM